MDSPLPERNYKQALPVPRHGWEGLERKLRFLILGAVVPLAKIAILSLAALLSFNLS